MADHSSNIARAAASSTVRAYSWCSAMPVRSHVSLSIASSSGSAARSARTAEIGNRLSSTRSAPGALREALLFWRGPQAVALPSVRSQEPRSGWHLASSSARETRCSKRLRHPLCERRRLRPEPNAAPPRARSPPGHGRRIQFPDCLRKAGAAWGTPQKSGHPAPWNAPADEAAIRGVDPISDISRRTGSAGVASVRKAMRAGRRSGCVSTSSGSRRLSARSKDFLDLCVREGFCVEVECREYDGVVIPERVEPERPLARPCHHHSSGGDTDRCDFRLLGAARGDPWLGTMTATAALEELAILIDPARWILNATPSDGPPLC